MGVPHRTPITSLVICVPKDDGYSTYPSNLAKHFQNWGEVMWVQRKQLRLEGLWNGIIVHYISAHSPLQSLGRFGAVGILVAALCLIAFLGFVFLRACNGCGSKKPTRGICKYKHTHRKLHLTRK